MAENNRLPLPDAVLEFVKLLDQSSMVACEGRFMDLEAQERLDISSDSYVKIAEAKSGALFSCAMEFGALAAGADADARRRFAGRRARSGCGGPDIRGYETACVRPR